MILLFAFSSNSKNHNTLVLPIVIAALLINNLMPSVVSINEILSQSIIAENEMKKLQAIEKISNLEYSFGRKDKTQFYGRYFSLLDNHISSNGFFNPSLECYTGSVFSYGYHADQFNSVCSLLQCIEHTERPINDHCLDPCSNLCLHHKQTVGV